ncbi:MAG: SLBB domain-containing protein [Acidobacteriia bacterium]|nr:SLBB domain-containing protein [Terriglobia bacterium]
MSAGLLLLVLWLVPGAQAQGQKDDTTNASDLSVQNLSHVAASAGELKTILLKDVGLMVELKRWVAKDATDHGQIVSDLDLTSEAVFERLESDLQFRSVATALVQRYGYLLPKLNPDSEAAKEQTLLIQERTKWLAQNQEEELTQARQRRTQNPQNAGSCDPQFDRTCSIPQTRPSPASGPGQEPQLGQPPFRTAPGGENPSDLPNAGGNPTMRAQLMQTAGDSTALSSSRLPLPGFYDSGSSANTPNVNASESIGTQAAGAGAGRPSGSAFARGNSGMGSPSDGLLAAYGGGMGMNTPMGGWPDGGGMNGRGTGPSASLGASPVLPMQPPNRRSPSTAVPQPPEMIRKPSPYDDIPSLYDMYVQAVTRPAAPRRFGAEVFENGTRDSQLIPMDLPVGPDYIVGPGDGLSVDLWGGVSQRLYRTVDREGRVSLPEVGPILVSGKSLAAVQQNLQQILRTQFRDVSADVSLARLRTIRVYEVGDVVNPGAYDISSLSTPLNALFVAGGPTPRGSMRILKHYRGTRLIETVDVYDLLLHGVKTDLQRLENGDSVQVPPIGPQVTVEGMVRRPAIYELRDEKTLASVLELAGGLLPTATLRHIEVQRLVAHEKQTMLSLDIPETDSDAIVRQKLESFGIHDGDRVRIYPIVPYNQDTIYLEGHVVRPGRYSFRAEMRVTDVISSYKDLLPEPSTRYAEIIRLNAPDFHPSVEGFDLADALANPSKAPVLHPMDTVRIFSRFDFENPPTISVLGDVRMPGTYQTSGQLRLTDAVHLAGGLAPDAEMADAQVFRYLPDGKFKIFSVSLSQALGGDPVENIILQPRDRLLIHRNPDTVEPATVYVQGEVARPGRYPLTTNMRVADLIRVGGGMKPSADTQAGDLIKYQWSDQNKLSGQQEVIALSAALAGDPNSNVPMHNGDVLTIRRMPGWDDLGASIVLKGEVKHPGTYGIRPGERLSSILERAGGFQPDAYPYGAILQRVQVRELESSAQNEMILRVKDVQSNLQLLPDTDPKQKQAKEAVLEQWQTTLLQLSSNPPLGRVTIRISSKVDQWRNTSADIGVRAGDTLVIPKRPSYVIVTGQVFNSTAVSFRGGKSAKWYLSQSGGPTQLANKKAIFVIRADGSVVGTKSSLWSGESLSATLQPGDTIVVPEKAFGGGVQWQSILLIAQTASAISTSVLIGMHY